MGAWWSGVPEVAPVSKQGVSPEKEYGVTLEAEEEPEPEPESEKEEDVDVEQNKFNSFMNKWKNVMGILFGDFMLQLSIYLTTSLILVFESGQAVGYTSLVPFYQTRISAVVASLISLPIAAVTDSYFGTGVVSLTSLIIECIIILIGFLTTIPSLSTGDKHLLFVIMTFFNFHVLIFEPIRTAIVIQQGLVHTNPIALSIVCIVVIWLRELALVLNAIIIITLRNVPYFQMHINGICLVCVILYIIMVLKLKQQRPLKKQLMFLRMCKYYFSVHFQKCFTAKTEDIYVDYGYTKFTKLEKICTSKLIRMYGALSVFIIYYLLKQFLFVIWDFQTKVMESNYFEFLISGQLKVAAINLINIPLVHALIFPFVFNKIKCTTFTEVKLVGLAYLSLFVSLIVTMVAQINSDEIYNRLPGTDTAQVKIYNMMDGLVTINSTWTGTQELAPFSLYISDYFYAKGNVSTVLEVNGPPPMEFTKSIFVKEYECASFIIIKDILRRVSGFDPVHHGALDTNQDAALMVIHNVLGIQGQVAVTFATNEVYNITLPLLHEKTIKIFRAGKYFVGLKQDGAGHKIKVGGVYALIFYRTNNSDQYQHHVYFEPPPFDAWSLIGLFFLSLALSIEEIVLINFIASEAPAPILCILLGLYYFNKVIGSSLYFLTARIWEVTNIILGMFLGIWLHIANTCFYWSVTLRYKYNYEL